MMQMLAAGGMEPLTDHVRQPNEDNPRGYFEFEPVKRTQRDASWVPQASGKAVKVIHALLDFLPDGFEYRVILMKRPMEEILRSQRTMLERSGKAGADIPDDRLTRVFQQQLQKAEERMASRAGFHVLPVAYCDCRERTAETIQAMQQFLGSQLDAARMQAAVDPSLYRPPV
jgi:hypothetical protein